jgi:hypothetical protein
MPSTKARGTRGAAKPARRKQARKPATPKAQVATDAGLEPISPPEPVVEQVAPPPAEPPQPEPVAEEPAQEPIAEEPEQSVETALEPVVEQPGPQTEPVATIAVPERVQVGPIEGTLLRISPEDVLGLLGQPALDRIAFLRGNGAISDLAARMRASEGRCAPVYFTVDEEGGGAPAIFDGYEALAAALNAGMEQISMICVRHRDGDYLQGYLASQLAKPPTDEDDLLYAVMADED